MKVSAIIVAGGSGVRAGGDVPKQFVEVNGRPILDYCIEKFENSKVNEIIVVAPKDRHDYVVETVRKMGRSKVTKIVEGGKERYDSVLNGLRACGTYPMQAEYSLPEVTMIQENFDKITTGDPIDDNPDFVLIHDGARPYITPEMIDKTIGEVRKNDAAIVAAPASDTIKFSDDDGYVAFTTVRSKTWQVQTPQAFNYYLIRDAYEKFVAPGVDESMSITDDAMVFEIAYSEWKVKLVESTCLNSKITTADDLEFAKWKLA